MSMHNQLQRYIECLEKKWIQEFNNENSLFTTIYGIHLANELEELVGYYIIDSVVSILLSFNLQKSETPTKTQLTSKINDYLSSETAKSQKKSLKLETFETIRTIFLVLSPEFGEETKQGVKYTEILHNNKSDKRDLNIQQSEVNDNEGRQFEIVNQINKNLTTPNMNLSYYIHSVSTLIDKYLNELLEFSTGIVVQNLMQNSPSKIKSKHISSPQNKIRKIIDEIKLINPLLVNAFELFVLDESLHSHHILLSILGIFNDISRQQKIKIKIKDLTDNPHYQYLANTATQEFKEEFEKFKEFSTSLHYDPFIRFIRELEPVIRIQSLSKELFKYLAMIDFLVTLAQKPELCQ